MANVERTATRIAGFASAEMDFQLMRSLGAANCGGGTPGEVFAARRAIAGDDPYGWPPAFAELAERVSVSAAEAETRGFSVSARESYLRASMYFRSAEYFADPFSPQQRKWGLKSRDTFVRAATHMADRIEPIEVPFEGTTLPGYFMAPAGGAHDGRTVVVLTGFDGTGEELYFQAAVGGLARGFNVFICEGPGQVGCLRFHPELVFRPDYETPIAAMIDAALQRPEVAAERLALYGISFGGYFVIRAGAHDRRIKALVANSPIVDLGAYLLAFIGIGSSRDVPPLKLSEVDAVPDSEFPPAMKLAFKSACPRFGVDTFASWIERLKDFTAVDGLDRIACPTLAMVGSGEGAAIAQAERYRDRVAGPASYRLFSEQEGADMHCQVGNLPLSCAVVYDWLAETFSR